MNFTTHQPPGRLYAELLATGAGGTPASSEAVWTALTQEGKAREAFAAAMRWEGRPPFRIEFPPLSAETLGAAFSAVMLPSPSLDRRPDFSAFAGPAAAAGGRVAAFPNLGGDALLVVPKPERPGSNFCHVQRFYTEASPGLRAEFTRVLAERVLDRCGRETVWLNAAGAGVPWFHMRLDRGPKYYRVLG